MPMPWQSGSTWLWGLLVALSATALVLPLALHGAPTPPDVIEHLAIANAWVHGQGFVDPVQYFYYLPTPPPLAAFAVRAPLVPLMLALPVSLDMGLEAIFLGHSLFAVLAVTATFVLLLRFMSAPAAAAAALCAASTPAFMLVAVKPLTEVTGCLLVVAVVATAGRARREVFSALLCAALSWLAWLARPNLGVLVAVVCAAMVLELGPRAALRHRPLQVYLGSYGALYFITRLAVSASTGLAPYVGYGIVTEHFAVESFATYGRSYVGALSFVGDHLGEIVGVTWHRTGQLLSALLLAPGHNRLGWLLPIGFLHSAFAWSRVRFEQRLCTLASLAFAIPVVANYAAFDPIRYPMFPLMAGLIASFMALDDVLPMLVRRWAKARESRWRRRGVLLAALSIFALVGVRAATIPLRGTPRSELPEDTPARLAALPAIADVCPLLDPDARVATADPWSLHLLCGNAAIITPVDIDEPGIWERFLAERQPAYLIERRRRRGARAGLTELGGSRRYFVYAVSEPTPGSRPWRAAPALICAGADPICELRDGRLRVRAAKTTEVTTEVLPGQR
jgi:hypothetical protein